MSDRPPCVESEAAVVSGLLHDNRLADDLREHASPSDFFSVPLGHIYAAALSLVEKGSPADPVTVMEELSRRGRLEAVGGPAAIMQAAEWGGASANAVHHASTVREAAVRRRMIEFGRTFGEDAADIRRSPAELVAKLGTIHEELEPSLNGRTKPPAPIPGPEFARRSFPTRDSLIGSGLLHAGEMALLYATSGLGKTFYSEQLGHAVANGSEFFGFSTPTNGVPVLIVQLEVDPWRLQVRRSFRWPHGVPNLHTITAEDFGRTVSLLDPADQLMLTRMVRSVGARLLILDPLHELHDQDENNQTFHQIARACKNIMLKTECAVLLVHHESKESSDPKAKRSDQDAFRGGTRLMGACKLALRLKATPAGQHVITFAKVSYGARPADIYVRQDEHGFWEPTEAPVNKSEITVEALDKFLAAAGSAGLTYSELMAYTAGVKGGSKTRKGVRDALSRLAQKHGLKDFDNLNIGTEKRPMFIHPDEVNGTTEPNGSFGQVPLSETVDGNDDAGF